MGVIRKAFIVPLDFAYALYLELRALGQGRRPPVLSSTGALPPIVMLPGVYEPWTFMAPLARQLAAQGHPVYFIDALNYHTRNIPDVAEAVYQLIARYDLRDVRIIAHSKGGLVGKYVLLKFNGERRVERVIAIVSPFNGSAYARLFLIGPLRVFRPKGRLIRRLRFERDVNGKIVSLYGCYDPLIPSGSHLEGATNIELPVYGHWLPLRNKRVQREVARLVS